jgi:hypothetical protein
VLARFVLKACHRGAGAKRRRPTERRRSRGHHPWMSSALHALTGRMLGCVAAWWRRIAGSGPTDAPRPPCTVTPRRMAGRRLSSWAARGSVSGLGGPAALAGRRTVAGSRFSSASAASLATTTSRPIGQHQGPEAGAVGRTHAGHHTHPGRRCQQECHLRGLSPPFNATGARSQKR